MKLQYEIAVTGEQQLRRVVRGVEGELKSSSRRVHAESRRSTGGAGSMLTGGGDQAYWRRAAAGSARVREQAERQVSRVAQREQAARQRMEEQGFRRKVGMQNRYFAQEQRDRAKLDRAEQAHRAKARQTRAKAAESMASGAGRSVRSAVGGVAAVGGMALGVAGGFASANAIRDQMDIRGRAARLANQSGDPSSKGKLAAESQNVRGFTGGETLTAMEGFVTKTGDLGAARAMIKQMGTLALATGTDFGELGEAAGQAFNVIRDTVKDPQQQVAMLGRVMNTLAGQGNLGAVEIRDMATELGTLGAATRKFQGGPEELLKTVGAMSQAAVARGGAASAAEASTSVVRFAGDIVKHTDDFEKITGKSAFVKGSGNTQIRDPKELIVDMLQGSGGDLTKIKEVFGEYGERAVGGFSPLYTEAERANGALAPGKRQKKGEAGAAAVQAEFKKFTGAGMSDSDLAARAASVMEEPEMQFKEATKAFNLAVGTQLLPVISKLIPEFTALVPAIGGAARIFAKLVSSFAAFPVTGIGLMIGGAVVKDIVSAKIGSMIKNAIVGGLTRMPGGMGGPATGAAGTGAGGTATDGGKPAVGAAVANGAVLGTAVAAAIITAGVVNFETGEASMAAGGKNVLAAEASKDPAEIRKLRDEEQAKLDKRKRPGLMESLGNALPWWMTPGGGKNPEFGSHVASATDSEKKTELNTSEGYIVRYDAALARAEAAAVEQAKATAALEAASKNIDSAASKISGGASRSQPIISKDRT